MSSRAPRRTAVITLLAAALIASANVAPAQAATDVTLCIKDGLIVRAVERVAACPARARRVVLTAPVGAMGPQGPAGPAGAEGARGETGPMGPQGPSGGTGGQGAQGEQGLQGAQGLQGEQGLQGTQGIRGATGSQGLQGPTGATGAAGAVASYLFDRGVNVVLSNSGTTVMTSETIVPVGKYVATLTVGVEKTGTTSEYNLQCKLLYGSSNTSWSPYTRLNGNYSYDMITAAYAFASTSAAAVSVVCSADIGGSAVSGLTAIRYTLTLVQASSLTS